MYFIYPSTSNRRTLVVCRAHFTLQSFVERSLDLADTKDGSLFHAPSRRAGFSGVGSHPPRVLKRNRSHLYYSAPYMDTACQYTVVPSPIKYSVRPNSERGLVPRVEEGDPITLGYDSQALQRSQIFTMPSGSGYDPSVFETIMNSWAEAGFDLTSAIPDLPVAIVEWGMYTARRRVRISSVKQGRRTADR